MKNKTVSADYIILPISSSTVGQVLTFTNEMKMLMPVGHHFTSTLIALDEDKFEMFTACLLCKEPHGKYHFSEVPTKFGAFILNGIPLEKLPVFQTIQELNRDWLYINARPLPLNVSRVNTFAYTTPCPYNGTELLTARFLNQPGFLIPRCLHDYILSACNSSFQMNIFEQVSNLRFSHSSSFDTILEYGHEFHGIRYSIFISGHVEKRKLCNMISLLSPFSLAAWLLITGCFLLFLIFYKWSGMKETVLHLFFWLYAILLEQDASVQPQIRFLVLVWLFGTLLLRNFYTSTLYTNMTKDTPLSGIPQSFENILESNETLNLVGFVDTDVIVQGLYTQALTGGLVELPMMERIMDRLDPKLWIILDSARMMNKLSFGTDHSEWDCVHNPFSAGEDAEKIVDKNFECLSWGRFALLHATNPAVLGYVQDFSLYNKAIIELFGGHQLFDNSEPAHFTELWTWGIPSKSYLLGHFQRRVTTFVESGISSFQKYYMHITQQKIVLEDFIKNSQLNGTVSWNLFTLASQLASPSKSIEFGWSQEHEKVQADILLSRQIYERSSGKVTDLIVVWALFGFLVVFALLACILEGVTANIGKLSKCKKYTI